ncbi:phosphoenolpyruvate synthase [bacterium CG10_46_32]|nr:MAG: phosphoenolpyruvate synthase [bacterium CG10_46_32]PIR56135.1 MAG: phosphoenolpyruvate synthase [Parcubacteria group bacterium CG10_big_fil_rev_8_21_14_0_10_46_32]
MKYIKFFNELTIKDVPLVGGKNASLGEMVQKLGKKINVPDGFAVTAQGYEYFLEKAGINEEIKRQLLGLDTSNMKELSERGRNIRSAVLSAAIPLDLKQEIIVAYQKLSKKYTRSLRSSARGGLGRDDVRGISVAVRSSATAEDLPDASFAGQQESYLNIEGENALLEAVKKCMASLFTDRAISYRVDKGFAHKGVALSVGVQKMVRSDTASAGVMFTLDTESGFRDVVLISGSWGLGELVVKGKVSPDEYYVFKPLLKKNFKPIVGKTLGTKKEKMVYSTGDSDPTKTVDVTEEDQRRHVLTDAEILQLAKWGMVIEDHYKRPMDIEWAKDGKDNKIYIVQARPETVQAQRDAHMLEEFRIKQKGSILIRGQAVGAKLGIGKIRVIKDVSGFATFKAGEILATEMTDPDWEPIMKLASGIVTNAGGRTCHAAIVARELGIPAIVGTKNATEILKTGTLATISCAEGEVGFVYKGKASYTIIKHDLRTLPKTRTKIMMNLASPEKAFMDSFIPNSGVGLAREEFIINTFIQIHPLALVNYSTIKDQEVKAKIDALTTGYKDKSLFFVDKLAEGVGRIAAAFYPKDVIVRMSDFKTNEYANLIGGTEYEPKENNPMIGWRGASRYYDEKYLAGFALECRAMKKAREEMGLTNIKLMVPFCRTIKEGKQVLAVMAKHGLKRGVKNLEVYVMAEIPSNVILAKEFAEIFDGFSIGSNDLTQLVLGVDRDSHIVSHIYDENNEAVKKMISDLIKAAKAAGRKVGICGQAPSDYPEFAAWLAREGIDSMSLTPDSVVGVIERVAKAEKKK